MKTLKRPLALVSALIIVSLLLSWRYFDEMPPAISPKDQETDAALIAWMAEHAADQLQQDAEDDLPPAAEDVLVQKIPGDNGHLLMIAFYSKENYSRPSFTIENGYTMTFRDDGRGVDKTAGDGLYTAMITADVKAFRQQVITMARQMRANGYKPLRYINRQSVVDPNATDRFDASRFDSNQPVSISALTNALSEDFSTPAASLQQPNGGAAARSSSTAMAASATLTGQAATTATNKPTLLDSLKKNSILITNLAVVEDPTRTWNACAQTGNATGAWTFNTLMRQLASKDPAHIATDAQVSDFVKAWLNNWAVTQVVNGDSVKPRTLVNSLILNPWLSKSQSHGAPAGQLDMKFAPFKLTAIVNRFDLRTGKKFGLPSHPCGEARFVFCLIKSDCSGPSEFTVIFEYGVNKPNTCEAQHAWAQQWVNLKNFALGSSKYNTALQNITDQFTKCGTNTSRPNQSSLDQLRTNEVALSPSPEKWEFREFILDSATRKLKENTVAQNPSDRYDVQDNNADVQRMVSYVNNHQTSINAQKNITPLSLKGVPFLGGSARVNGEATGTPPNIYYWDGTKASSASTFITNDNTRFNFSLQTCTGCHSGETQTGFTHIDPAFYGREAGLSGFLSGTAGRNGAVDFDDDPSNGVMSVKDAALRPSGNPTIRTFNDINARAKALKKFVSTTCGTPLAISSQLLFQPTTMVH